MPTELHFPRRATFVERPHMGEDGQERRYAGPGTFEVPEDHVDLYLERGWERPDESGEDAAPVESETTESEDGDTVEEADAAETMVPDQDQAAESEPDAESESDGFDAEAFIARTYQEVSGDIEDGVADEHLDAVESAEQDRENGPRDSVIEAIESRR